MGAGPLVEGKALGAAAIRLEAIAVGLGDLEENGVRVRVCACVHAFICTRVRVCVTCSWSQGLHAARRSRQEEVEE